MSTLNVNDIQEATSGGGKIFPPRAWVNFNGTGTVAIRDDGNVSSITDNGTGLYRVNFSNNLTDANYAVSQGGAGDQSYNTSSGNVMAVRYDSAPSSGSFDCVTGDHGNGASIPADLIAVHFAVTR